MKLLIKEQNPYLNDDEIEHMISRILEKKIIQLFHNHLLPLMFLVMTR